MFHQVTRFYKVQTLCIKQELAVEKRKKKLGFSDWRQPRCLSIKQKKKKKDQNFKDITAYTSLQQYKDI